MRKNKAVVGMLTMSATLLLAACSTETTDNPELIESASTSMGMDSMTSESMSGMEDMVHDDSGEIPTGLKEAENPTYKVGDKVTLMTDHMAGMDGAEATIVGAFDTIAYEVSYNPTNGDERVENHKWVIQEELTNTDMDPLEPGKEAVINAKHMPDMEGATAIIDSAEETTVYMVDYEPTTGEEKVKNHKWLTESELSTLE
ncbi:hypothetical protein BW727_101976 [Jeotgalibaca dankookensis]|uniref:DUF1541 domain-containing protein n=1 Tax=Jeotgalibaca dankookensis TaxID=708126 RepID=A0A1S6IS55_9LACT|nr:YdhK family protein [Jeotgalibaca dankookensis]AQS54300.1 hypothetical protein BW727_101976 [Jeotgalibaca dankookensis]